MAEGAMVIGNIYCTRILMEEGAQFNGKIEMTIPVPLKIAPEPEEVEEKFGEAENLTA
jgi:cytoskeletal protein CcmA (bactofilin family)